MEFKEYGKPNMPTVMLIHDAGLSYWAYKNIKNKLIDSFRVVLPIIDGHDGTHTEFISIKHEADEIMSYIYNHCDGHIFMIGGLSLGGKIALEVLARKSDIASYAIIESVDIYPTKGIASIATVAAKSFKSLTKYKWFTMRQAQATGLPKELYKNYHNSIKKLSRLTLENLVKEDYSFELPKTLKNSEAKALVIFGEKEPYDIRRSARIINETINYSQMYQILGMGHGEFSLQHPNHYVRLFKRLLKN